MLSIPGVSERRSIISIKSGEEGEGQTKGEERKCVYARGWMKEMDVLCRCQF